MSMMGALGAGAEPLRVSCLELDIATVLARLIQLDELRSGGGSLALSDFIWFRVVNCDVPRLRRHLSSDACALLDQLTELPGESRDSVGGRA